MSVSRPSAFWPILGASLVVVVLAWQQRSIQTLRSEVARLRVSSSSHSIPPANDPADTVPDRGSVPRASSAQATSGAPDERFLARRVSALEESVALLNRSAEHLMDRGEVPPSPAKAEELRLTFLDPNRPVRDRIAALRLLRQNGLFGEEVAQAAAQWLASSTDPDTTRTLLNGLRGADHAALSAVTLNLASSGAERRIREAAIANLRNFVQDPQIESALWQLAASDPAPEIRRRAEDALRRAPITEDRVARLTARALNASASLDERLISFRLLRGAEQDVAQVAPVLSQIAQNTADAGSRLKLYAAFDEVNRPEFMLPLVQGVQDQDPEVRLRAADALLDYRTDPTIQEWLKVLAESDPDPRVREEASQAFRPERRNQGGAPRGR